MRKWTVLAIALLAGGVLGGCMAALGKSPSDLVGTPAPEIGAGYWINSPPLALTDLRGKAVVVEFWSAMCHTCRETFPHLIALHKKYADRGVVFIGLTDEPRSWIDGFVKELRPPFALGGSSLTSGAYAVRITPTAFVVDAGGTIVWAGSPKDPGFDAAIDEQARKIKP